MYKDAYSLYGWAMRDYLPYDKNKFYRNVQLEDKFNTPDDSDFGHFIEVDLTYPENIKEETKHFPFAPEKKIEPDTYTQTKKLISDWSDKKNFLIHYRMLKIFNRHGMIIDKAHEIVSFKQSNWLVKLINFNTQKRIQAVNVFERDLYKLLKNAFMVKQWKM